MGSEYLGIEFGSTKIKAVTIDDDFLPVTSGEFTWKSRLENGVWTYDLEDAWKGVKAALSAAGGIREVKAAGISGMMHGYLAFDKDWNLLAPFRTWQNTITGEAADALTELFGFNIPQRWSIAHLYQAILNGEEHTGKIAHITTLAGYIHHALTGVNAVGIGEASGMFPIDEKTGTYDAEICAKFDALGVVNAKITDLLPKALRAGESAGTLTKEGAALLDGLLSEGLPFAPPEGDAGTGMTATNSISAGTGNVSAGTSIFSMVVLERPLKKVYPEIDVVATPEGRPAAMVHCNNCTNDMNRWAGVLAETVRLFHNDDDYEEKIYKKLYLKSLEGAPDCGGITVYNYMAGESVTGLDSGKPLVIREPDADFTLANFIRAQLYSSIATLKIGMDILEEEGVEIKRLTGHGGLFKTPGVGQRYLAAACKVPVSCMDTAGQGGPYGMAVLAAYLFKKGEGETLEEYLNEKVFKNTAASVMVPNEEDVRGFETYVGRFKKGLSAEIAAAEEMD